MAIEVRVLYEPDLVVLERVAEGVFDNPINCGFAAEFLADPRHHLAVAIDDGVVVGFASGVHYIHPDKASQMWINEVGVAPTHRRRGLAKAVLLTLLDVARSCRCAEAWVLTDTHNPAAVSLYKSLGGHDGAYDSDPSDAILGFTFKL